ncbi:hypothetical protein Tco_1411620 [Tanacetum coccineum]
MANLKFADTHNMVAFLSKPAESDGFEQIVDFLNAQPIRYALTVNPTIYISCIEQFWSTGVVKTINGEVQLHALVDGKKIIISEASVRRDLKLEDEEGIDCLPNSTIFEQLALMGYEKISQKLTFYKPFFSPQWKFLIHTILQCLSPKTTTWNEFSSTMASAIICLATNQKFNFSKFIFEGMIRNLDNVSGKFLMYPRFAQVFLNQQLDGLPTHKRIYNAPSHTKKIFGNMRRAGKGFSGRVTPLFPTMVVQHQSQMGEEVNAASEEVSTAEFDILRKVLTGQNENVVGKVVDAAQVSTAATTVTITTEEITLAQAPEALKTSKHKVKGIVFQEPGKSTTTTTISAQQSQDKGKGRMIKETVKPIKKKDQISFDEVALKLQAEFDEEERLAREKVEKEKEANIALIEE